MADSDEGKKDDEAASSGVASINPTISVDPPRMSANLSDASASIVAESLELLGLKSSVPATLRPPTKGNGLPLMRSRSNSPDSGAYSSFSSAPVYPKPTPTFKRIDFDDRLTELCEDRQPAWKTLQNNVKDSYHKARRTVERTKDEAEFLDSTLNRTRRRRDSQSPFRQLHTETGFVPSIRSSSSLTMPSLSDRSRLMSSASHSTVFASGSGPYAAPAVSYSQGLESRYEDIARDVEARLLRNLPLSAATKSITMKEFRRAPEPSSGSASEDKDDYDFLRYAPKPYYSRPNRDDPDYFDFDLQHSVNLFKRPEGRYVPKKPQEWESKLVGEAGGKGSSTLSGYMFTKGDTDWRTNGSSYLSAALRTPKFWEQRFERLGKEVRDSNPISLDSINRRIRQIAEDRRNRPVTSRFTEYRDPDFDDYVDPREDD